MKYMFASDIHGSAFYCEKTVQAFKESGAERLILLGDLLNQMKDKIYAVRGNCEAEVDQMVLEFPVMADYGVLVLNGITFYATHGHIMNEEHMPPIQPGDVLIHGHTHVLRADKVGDHVIINPGSTSIPKEGNPPTYGILEDQTFKILTFSGEVVKEISLKQ